MLHFFGIPTRWIPVRPADGNGYIACLVRCYAPRQGLDRSSIRCRSYHRHSGAYMRNVWMIKNVDTATRVTANSRHFYFGKSHCVPSSFYSSMYAQIWNLHFYCALKRNPAYYGRTHPVSLHSCHSDIKNRCCFIILTYAVPKRILYFILALFSCDLNSILS